MDSRFRGNDGRCINHGHVDGIIPASAGMTGGGVRGDPECPVPAMQGWVRVHSSAQKTAPGFHLRTRRSMRDVVAKKATARPAPRITVAYSSGARKL